MIEAGRTINPDNMVNLSYAFKSKTPNLLTALG
jgi:hypothetical protein